MEPNNNFIITEDGQRLPTVNESLITRTEDPGPGLAYETGNVQDEKSGQNEKSENTCATSVNKKDDK